MKFHKIIYGTHLTKLYTSYSMILIIVIILTTKELVWIFSPSLSSNSDDGLPLLIISNNMSSNFNELRVISKRKIEKHTMPQSRVILSPTEY